MRIDLDDIQTNILRSVDPAFSLYLFFRISKTQAFRSFLASALKQNLTFAGMPTGLYAERHRLNRRSRSVEAAAMETESPTRSHSLHMNVGFTWPGLMRLGVEKETCASFPEPFREGMAARATILGDVGAAAPEYWDGYLGSRTVDGVILWNWWNIRKEHRLPGRVHDKLKQLALDTWDEIKRAASAHGIEILHTETGVANYRQFASGDIDRVEHFGFRDGISQPWIDFGVADANGLSHPAPGGGTPRENGQWAPLAPGEFVLGYPDEDGLIQPWPCNRRLQCGGMYMVFRKLEQDVIGFRNFLRDASPDPVASGLLAAQMFGRWPDGTSLVQSPHGPDDRTPRDPNRPLNDFRYERDDRDGRRCPIGAHIRRSNPRDTRGRNESRRHRLLRRGITYGGPILPHDSPGDGRRRGVLFVALNARIDQQFEFVQSRWLNSGELVGQVGAGRDPINATNEGQLSDSFWAHSRPAPVTNLTRFVTMRGGDYFFVPGFEALRGLANHDRFPAFDQTRQPRKTPIGKQQKLSLFDPDALFRRGRRELLPEGSKPYFSQVLPFIEHENAKARDYTVVFIGRHENVLKVLHDEQHFSVRPYKDAIARITGGENMIVGMPSGDCERQRRMAIWHDAQEAYRKARDAEETYKRVTIEAIIDATVSGIIARCAPIGRLDVARDVGCIVPLELARSYYGIPGPDWLSPTAVAVNFNKLTVTDVPRSWLESLPPVDPQDIPFVSLVAWTRFAFAQVFINIQRASELIDIAQRTTVELFGHLDDLIAKAHRSKKENQSKVNNKTLLGCMVDNVPDDLTFDEFNEHNKRIRLVLAERIVGGTDTLNKAIVNVIDFLLKCPDSLKQARNAAEEVEQALKLMARSPSAAAEQELAQAQSKLDAVIRECLRFNPVAPMICRACEDDIKIEGWPIKKGTLVCLLMKTAMFDPKVFSRPDDFVPDRVGNSYLTFGAAPHACAGQDVAETVLRIVIKRLLLLKDLRRAAGPAGELKNVFGLPLPDSMVVRFSL